MSTAISSRSRRLPAPSSVIVLALMACLYGVFFVWPVATIGLRSFSPDGLASLADGATLDHYRSIGSDPVMRTVVWNTVVIAGLSTVVTFVLAFPVAYLMSRVGQRLATVLLLAIMLPFWVSILVRLFAFVEILAKDGPVKQALGGLGVEGPDLLLSRTGTIIGMVNYLLPYMILILFTGMRSVDTNILRAAHTLGSSGWHTFRKIYIPMIRRSMVGGLLLVFVIASGFFLTPAILGGPNDATVATYIARQVQALQWGRASAIGVLLMVLTMVGFIVAARMTGLTGGAATRSGSKGIARIEPMNFGWLKAVLWLCTVVVLIVLMAPLIITVPLSWGTTSIVTFPPRGFTLEWYSDAVYNPMWSASLRKSLVVSALVAVGSVAIALLLGRVMQRLESRSRLHAALTGVIFLPLVTPVILLAIGTYGVQSSIGALGTTWGLVAVETVLALPFTFLVISAALANVDSSMEEAAWTMGASEARTMRSVVVPVIVPALIGAGLLAFVSAWDEAVVALFQTGFDKTLPVTFYSFLQSGATPTMAAIGTLIIISIIVGSGLYHLLTSQRMVSVIAQWRSTANRKRDRKEDLT